MGKKDCKSLRLGRTAVKLDITWQAHSGMQSFVTTCIRPVQDEAFNLSAWLRKEVMRPHTYLKNYWQQVVFSQGQNHFFFQAYGPCCLPTVQWVVPHTCTHRQHYWTQWAIFLKQSGDRAQSSVSLLCVWRRQCYISHITEAEKQQAKQAAKQEKKKSPEIPDAVTDWACLSRKQPLPVARVSHNAQPLPVNLRTLTTKSKHYA